jgi:diguanylate cyclase (GGDEF)-like protein
MFWKKKATDDEGSSPTHEPGASGGTRLDPLTEAALDTVVGILRAFGRHAFEVASMDLATFRQRCEDWAEHLAVGAPHPEAGSGVARSERDFPGARRFVARRRQDEAEFIAQSLGELREVIADLTERLATTLIEDQDGARLIGEQVERLRAAATISSLAALRVEVITVADLLGRLVDQHGQRLRGQLIELDLKVATLSEELQEVKHESSLDPLTRVFNRGAFDRTFTRLYRVNAVSAQPSTLLVVDLDNLKQINDRYGHRSGDEALRRFADCLVRNFPRRSDFIARYGGDEFVAILPQTPASQSERLARRFLDAVHALDLPYGDATFKITGSVGLAELAQGESAESWLDRADRALYAAKTGGRGRLTIAT